MATSRSDNGEDPQGQLDAPADPSHADIFGTSESLSTSRTYRGSRPYRGRRQQALERAIAHFKAAREAREEWYVWVAETWSPRMPPPRPYPAESWSSPRSEKQLRGAAADEVARRYLDGALDDGLWHEREGLMILALATGVSRASFERALAGYELEEERRGFLEEHFLRLAPVTVNGVNSPEIESVIVAELRALAGEERGAA
jgi:hypothetical protein